MAKSAAKIRNMLGCVLERIRPDEKEIVEKVSFFSGLIQNQLKKENIKAKVIVGGSIGKGTSIKGDHDVDLFIAFDRGYESEKLSDILESVLKKINFGNELGELSVNRLHGSRDYFRIINSLNFELVPVIEIKNPDEARNITDCSPMHVVWVKENMKKNPKIGDEIRLVKAFCKSAGVYGAESYIKGFSGHVVDILTIYYGGFLNLLKASLKWKYKEKNKEVIDFNKVHKGKALFMLNQSKLQSPIIVVDPIQKERNAAAALEREKLEKFVEHAKKFLHKPSEEFFIKKMLSAEEIKNKAKAGRKAVILEAFPTEGKEDVVGAKLLKIFEFLKKSLVENEFEIFEADWLWQKGKRAVYYFIVSSKKLSPRRIISGPPAEMKDFAADFSKKHKKVFVKSGKLFAEEKREFTDAEKLVSSAIKDDYTKDKAGKIIILK